MNVLRGPGGGRKKLAETDPRLAAERRALVDPETRGDPMSPLDDQVDPATWPARADFGRARGL